MRSPLAGGGGWCGFICSNPIPAPCPRQALAVTPGILPAAISCFLSSLQAWVEEQSLHTKAYPCIRRNAKQKN